MMMSIKMTRKTFLYWPLLLRRKPLCHLYITWQSVEDGGISYSWWWWWQEGGWCWWHLLSTSGTTGRLVSKNGVFFSTTWTEARNGKFSLSHAGEVFLIIIIIKLCNHYDGFMIIYKGRKNVIVTDFKIDCLKILIQPEHGLVPLVFPQLASHQQSSS